MRALLRVPARLDTRRRTREGYLRADAALVRASIHPFTGSELPVLPEIDPDKQYGVLIDDNVVFAPETIDSARMKPVTLGHPTDDVTVDNYANLALVNNLVDEDEGRAALNGDPLFGELEPLDGVDADAKPD